MLKNKTNLAPLFKKKTLAQCVLLLSIGACSTAFATDFVYSDGVDIENVQTGDTITIASGTFNNNLNNLNGNTITVEDGAVFEPGTLSVNGAITLIINAGGTANLPGLNFNQIGSVIDNSGSVTFKEHINMNQKLEIINRAQVDGYDVPTMTFNNGLKLDYGSTITNEGKLDFNDQEFTIKNGELINEKTGTILVGDIIHESGNVTNYGFVQASGKININSDDNDSSSIVNYCSIVTTSEFTIDKDFVSAGIIFSDKHIQLNGSAGFTQNATGYVQGASLTVDTIVTGGGMYYFTGDTTQQSKDDPNTPERDGGFGDESETIIFYDASLENNLYFDTETGDLFGTIEREEILPITSDQAKSACTYAEIYPEPVGECSIDELAVGTYASGSPSSTSSYLSTSTRVFSSAFNSDDWSGSVTAYDLETDDAAGGVKSNKWDASFPATRKLFTYNAENVAEIAAETAAGDIYPGVSFEWDNLTAAQKATLKSTADVDSELVGQTRVTWLSTESSEETIKVSDALDITLRSRTNLLGDVVNSSLTFRNPLSSYGYELLSGEEGENYPSFLTTKAESDASLFVGSNGGMLHAFNAANGVEQFAYVPNEVLGKVATISDINYGCDGSDCLGHEYTVDGVSTVSDAYFGGKWRSVLVGTLGLGGRGLFALDVTNPASFSNSDVLWEISNDNAGFTNLGYTLASASVFKASNGKWLAAVGNGYESASAQSVLFLIDIETGELVKELNTGSGSAGAPNGLSTPTVVDSNGDSIGDKVYAGDLLGNVWAFDISSDNTNNWSTSKLFQACSDNACTNPQPITAAPQVGLNSEDGLMVYVGTGKYTELEDATNTAADFDSFYAIQDTGSTVTVARSTLVEQEVLAEATANTYTARVTTANSINYSTQNGWYLDLQSTSSDASELSDDSESIDASGDTQERVTAKALLRGGRVIFASMTPDVDECSLSGSSWVMELDAQTGTRLSDVVFDTNGDVQFVSSADDVTYEGELTTPSGLQIESGLIRKQLVRINHNSNSAGVYGSISNADEDAVSNIEMVRDARADITGRMSWTNVSN